MTPEIKDLKTWKEAERWLARHGFGIAQIEEQKELWDAAQEKSAEPVKTAEPVKPAEPVKAAPKTEPKTASQTIGKVKK